MKRIDFASKAVREKLGVLPKTHRNCMWATEQVFGKGNAVARPGKTAHERHRKAQKPVTQE